jgi:hypothetical protein
VEVFFVDHFCTFGFQLATVRGCQNEEILPLILFFSSHLKKCHVKTKQNAPSSTYFLDSDVYNVEQLYEDGEVRQNFDENDERVPDLHVVLGIEADDQRLGDFVVPLVAYVPVVLVADVVVGVRKLVADLELGDETGEVCALIVVGLLVAVPAHDRVKHGAQEATEPVGLVLCARSHHVRDITKYLQRKQIVVEKVR